MLHEMGQMHLRQVDSSQETLSVAATDPFPRQRSPPSCISAGTSAGTSTSKPEDLQNAVLDSMHTSATESILQWPHFDVFPSLRQMYVSVFHLEQCREPIKMRASTMYPYVSGADVEHIMASFGNSVNFWYPTMSIEKLKAVQCLISDRDREAEDSTSSCLALLVMALGCANLAIPRSATTAGTSRTDLSKAAVECRAARRAIGDMYMDTALKKLYVVHMEISTSATQCLFFVA